MYKNILIKDISHIKEAADVFIAQRGDDTVFAFNGKMGVGKTTFIKAVCEELGIKDAVNSPTFSIINEYNSETTGDYIYHFDFYRIKNLSEAYEIGAADYFESGCICFIEWPEIIKEMLPPGTVYVNVTEEGDGSRLLTFNKIE